MRKSNQKKGFTLVEVIVVLVILAVLAAILVPSFVAYIDKAHKAECKVNRGTLARNFVEMYDYNKELRSCTTQSQIEAITGSDVVKYMKDNDFYEGNITCPVHKVEYNFSFRLKNGTPVGVFTCPCVDDFAAYEKEVEEIAKNISTSADRKELIKAVYDEQGELKKVSAADLEGTAYEGQTQYWRPYRMADGSITYFANSNAYTAGNPQGSWAAKILKINGKIYVSNSTSGSVANFHKYKSFDELVNSEEFKNSFTEK